MYVEELQEHSWNLFAHHARESDSSATSDMAVKTWICPEKDIVQLFPN